MTHKVRHGKGRTAIESSSPLSSDDMYSFFITLSHFFFDSSVSLSFFMMADLLPCISIRARVCVPIKALHSLNIARSDARSWTSINQALPGNTFKQESITCGEFKHLLPLQKC